MLLSQLKDLMEKQKLDSLDGIDDNDKHFFTEAEDGGFTLNANVDLRTKNDVESMKKAKDNEKLEHHKTKEELRKWKELGKSPDELLSKINQLDELKVMSQEKDKSMDEKLNSLLEIKSRPLNQKIKDYEQKLKEYEEKVTFQRTEITKSKLKDKIISLANKKNIRQDALSDVIDVASRDLKFSDELNDFTYNDIGTAEDWMEKALEQREYWKQPSLGAGAKGNNGLNSSKVNSWEGIVSTIKS